jgi:hypothetical protein
VGADRRHEGTAQIVAGHEPQDTRRPKMRH